MKHKQFEPEIEVNLELVKASDITPKEVEWLWYPYILVQISLFRIALCVDNFLPRKYPLMADLNNSTIRGCFFNYPFLPDLFTAGQGFLIYSVRLILSTAIHRSCNRDRDFQRRYRRRYQPEQNTHSSCKPSP